MPTRYVSAVILTGLCAAALLGASTSAAPSVNYNSSKSNTGNVYFRDLSPKQQGALRSACAAHNGHVVANESGQLGCQVGSLSDSKNISDGAAKGQANE